MLPSYKRRPQISASKKIVKFNKRCGAHSNKYGKRSGPNFHIWNTNSQSFARAKSEAKMTALGDQFWTSVLVLFAVLYVSSSPLHEFNFQFLFGSTSKTFTTIEKVDRRNITGPVLHIRVFKRIRYWRMA